MKLLRSGTVKVCLRARKLYKYVVGGRKRGVQDIVRVGIDPPEEGTIRMLKDTDTEPIDLDIKS